MFKKGQPRHPDAGRKAGSPNKKRVAKVSDYLAEKDINPTAEILKLIPHMDYPDAAKAWLDLLSYTQAKPKEETETGNDNDGRDLTINDILDMVDVTPALASDPDE